VYPLSARQKANIIPPSKDPKKKCTDTSDNNIQSHIPILLSVNFHQSPARLLSKETATNAIPHRGTVNNSSYRGITSLD